MKEPTTKEGINPVIYRTITERIELEPGGYSIAGAAYDLLEKSQAGYLTLTFSDGTEEVYSMAPLSRAHRHLE